MTLDRTDRELVERIAQQMAAETVRNVGRGTGGATIAVPMFRPGAVYAEAPSTGEVLIIPDGDSDAVPMVNATGVALMAGDRVLACWNPPHGVYVTNLLSRFARGNWTPTLGGPSADATGASMAGHYVRNGHHVDVYGIWTFGSGTGMGSAATFGGLPFPVISDGNGIPAVLHGYINDVSVPRLHPVIWIVAEGQSSGQLWAHNAFGSTAVLLSAVASTGTPFPMTWASGDQVILNGSYVTDAA